MRLDKKGMMDDMFDFLVTVVAAVIILFFMMNINGAVMKKEGLVLKEVGKMNADNVLLNYLRAPVGEGKNIADLIATSGLDLEELEKKTSDFFSEEDCLMVVLPPLMEVSPEVLEAARGGLGIPEEMLERKVVHCPDENKARVFAKVPHLQTGEVELVGPDLNKIKVFLEYSHLK